MKNSSVYSQGLRIKRLCSDSKDCETHLKNPQNIIDNQLKRVKNVSREELLRSKERGNKNIGIPFIVTYHPHLKYLGKLIQTSDIYMLMSKLELSLHLHLLRHFVLHVT